MEQKCYINRNRNRNRNRDAELDIVEVLLKGGSHPRAIARILSMNPMTASRKLKELMERNVLDFREEGRNKTYFLKRTPEARNYAIMAENHKLLKALERHPEIRKIVEKVQSDNRIRLAMIFGSYAKGLEKKDSDIDLYIEGSDARLKKEMEGLYSRLSVKVGAYDRENLLIKEIEKSHIIIKGIEEYYGKTWVFG